jgi:hypothetical protein
MDISFCFPTETSDGRGGLEEMRGFVPFNEFTLVLLVNELWLRGIDGSLFMESVSLQRKIPELVLRAEEGNEEYASRSTNEDVWCNPRPNEALIVLRSEQLILDVVDMTAFFSFFIFFFALLTVESGITNDEDCVLSLQDNEEVTL